MRRLAQRLAYCLLSLSCWGASACTSLRSGFEVIRELDAGLVADASAADGAVACPAPGQRERVVLTEQELTEDTRWTCGQDYEIDGYVVVTKGTLTIDPDVTVYVRSGGFLLIGQDARIDAQGGPGAPIVFTAAARPAVPGSYLGVLLLGRAPTALPNSSTLGLPSGDARAFFGGSDARHDCGTLRFVRIELAGGDTNAYDFPGAALTLAGCGRRTRVENVQVHAATDGIGLLGGEAPLKRVLVTAPSADGIEWAAGYRGFIQFAIVQTFYGSGAALKGSRLDADQTTSPASAPVIFNATLVGANRQGLKQGSADPGGFETGIQLQAATRATVRNSLVVGFPGAWIDVLGAETARLVGDKTAITNSIFADPAARSTAPLPQDGVEAGDGEDDDGGFDEELTFSTSSLQNRFPSSGFALAGAYAQPPKRPVFSADGFVDGGNLAQTAPSGWDELWEPAFYAGALPKIQLESERELDWTCPLGMTDCSWTAFPAE